MAAASMRETRVASSRPMERTPIEKLRISNYVNAGSPKRQPYCTSLAHFLSWTVAQAFVDEEHFVPQSPQLPAYEDSATLERGKPISRAIFIVD